MTADGDDLRAAFTAAFDMETDPLLSFESVFEQTEADPFDLFLTESLLPTNPKSRTVDQYRTVFRQWAAFMDEVGRHPACPNAEHVSGFARWLRTEKSNHARATVEQKLAKLGCVYRFWQREPTLPHALDYDPVALGRDRVAWSGFDDESPKRPHPISVPTLRRILAAVEEIRPHAYMTTQLKLGLRVGELCNVRLSDVNLAYDELRDHYPRLGEHSRLADRPNSIYIPSKHERDGNKSEVARILPLDDEMQRLLRRYLLIRPSCGEPWLYISSHHTQSTPKDVNRAWKHAFHPAYDATEEYRAVTSHFARHRFTTYWKKEQGLPTEFVQYLRGDRVSGAPDSLSASSIDAYLHAYYEDIESRYRERIYRLLRSRDDTSSLLL